MTWGVGANDLANIISTTMGSKAISVRKALIIAFIFEFAGAFLGGSHVTNTVSHGIVNMQLLMHQPSILALGMLSILMAGAVWMGLASFLGMPVSITNAVVGGLVGFISIVFGTHAVEWSKVGAIAISWVCSPLIAGVFAILLFNSIRRLILSSTAPAKKVMRYLPIYLFLTGLVLAVMIVLKGCAHLGWTLNHEQNIIIAVVTAIIIMLVAMTYLRLRYPIVEKQPAHQQFSYVEKLFGALMALTACAMVFAHGSNDVAVAVGPIAAILSISHHQGQNLGFPAWITLLGVSGVVIGLFMYGRKVIETVGSGITALTPSRAFAATLAAASTVIVSTSTGIPVSATQTLVGGVLGVGLARGIGALNLNVVRNILLSWVVTIPATAGLATLFFYLLKTLLHSTNG
jgi:PiT family inorganic phosphate transporter